MVQARRVIAAFAVTTQPTTLLQSSTKRMTPPGAPGADLPLGASASPHLHL
uniref:Uncharacterized protein n=1 Tax=Arundo donax TaxID=35708 RepID=A0A0A8ZSI1_ARUDO